MSKGSLSKVSPVPDVHRPLVPQLTVKNSAKAMAFYQAAFGAVEEFRLLEPSGKVGHLEFRISGALLSLADEYPDFGCLSPAAIGGSPIRLQLYVADVDAATDQAVKAGATLVRPLRDEFYGDRTATVTDPFGYTWNLASRIEEVAPAEMQARFARHLG